MKHLRLVRVTEYKDATLGTLTVDNKPVAVTLEDKWRDNERMVSCIPPGDYLLKRHHSPKFGECFKVLNVPERDEILIHAGNTHIDTHGCILLGLMFGMIGDNASILSSRAAITNFMLELKNDDVAELTIVNVIGTR